MLRVGDREAQDLLRVEFHRRQRDRVRRRAARFLGIPSEEYGARVDVAPLELYEFFFPIAETLTGRASARHRGGRHVDIFFVRCDELLRGVLELMQVDHLRQPCGGHAMIAEEWQVLALVVQRRFKKSGEIDLSDALLIGGGHDLRVVQQARGKAVSVVETSPVGVELAVIGVVDKERGLEVVIAARELDALEDARSVERLHIAIGCAVQHEVIHVRDRPGDAGGFVLPIHRRDCRVSANRIVVSELDARVVRIVSERVERRGDGDGFSASGMSHESNAIDVHFFRGMDLRRTRSTRAIRGRVRAASIRARRFLL